MKDCSWVSPDFIRDPHNTQSCHSASYQFTLPQHTMPQLKPVLTSSDICLLAVTQVSQSQLFTTSSLTQCWLVERFRAHMEICLPQLSLICHTSVWRIGGVDLWPTTENTLFPAGGHTLVWGFKLETLWLFSGHGAMVCVCARNVHIEKIIKACVLVSRVGVYCCSLILRYYGIFFHYWIQMMCLTVSALPELSSFSSGTFFFSIPVELFCTTDRKTFLKHNASTTRFDGTDIFHGFIVTIFCAK